MYRDFIHKYLAIGLACAALINQASALAEQPREDALPGWSEVPAGQPLTPLTPAPSPEPVVKKPRPVLVAVWAVAPMVEPDPRILVALIGSGPDTMRRNLVISSKELQSINQEILRVGVAEYEYGGEAFSFSTLPALTGTSLKERFLEVRCESRGQWFDCRLETTLDSLDAHPYVLEAATFRAEGVGVLATVPSRAPTTKPLEHRVTNDDIEGALGDRSCSKHQLTMAPSLKLGHSQIEVSPQVPLSLTLQVPEKWKWADQRTCIHGVEGRGTLAKSTGVALSTNAAPAILSLRGLREEQVEQVSTHAVRVVRFGAAELRLATESLGNISILAKKASSDGFVQVGVKRPEAYTGPQACTFGCQTALSGSLDVCECVDILERAPYLSEKEQNRLKMDVKESRVEMDRQRPLKKLRCQRGSYVAVKGSSDIGDVYVFAVCPKGSGPRVELLHVEDFRPEGRNKLLVRDMKQVPSDPTLEVILSHVTRRFESSPELVYFMLEK